MLWVFLTTLGDHLKIDTAKYYSSAVQRITLNRLSLCSCASIRLNELLLISSANIRLNELILSQMLALLNTFLLCVLQV